VAFSPYSLQRLSTAYKTRSFTGNRNNSQYRYKRLLFEFLHWGTQINTIITKFAKKCFQLKQGGICLVMRIHSSPVGVAFVGQHAQCIMGVDNVIWQKGRQLSFKNKLDREQQN